MVISAWELWLVIAVLVLIFFSAFIGIVAWIITLRRVSYNARPPL